MNKVFAGLTFFLMATIFYSANVIAASIVKVNGGGQPDVGYLLIVFSIITFIIGLILLLTADRDAKYNAKEEKKRKNLFLIVI